MHIMMIISMKFMIQSEIVMFHSEVIFVINAHTRHDSRARDRSPPTQLLYSMSLRAHKKEYRNKNVYINVKS
jgi:hypothetical protein